MDNLYGLTLINMALEGSLDDFLDLYHLTIRAYCDVFKEHPDLQRGQGTEYVIPAVLPAYEEFINQRIGMFTSRLKEIHLTAQCFNRGFSFWDSKKISHCLWEIEWNKRCVSKGLKPIFPQYTNQDLNDIPVTELMIDVGTFVNQFRMIVLCAVKFGARCNAFQAVADVDGRIQDRMRVIHEQYRELNDERHTATEEPLYIYSALNSIVCKRDHHELEMRKYFVNQKKKSGTIPFPVHYCKTCKRYLCGSISLSLFTDFWGEFIVNKHNIEPYESHLWELNGESELHQRGYNVEAGKLSDLERRNLLISILESEQMTYFEVISTIEQNIRNFQNQARMSRAVEKWRNDLQFINDYMLTKQ